MPMSVQRVHGTLFALSACCVHMARRPLRKTVGHEIAQPHKAARSCSIAVVGIDTVQLKGLTLK